MKPQAQNSDAGGRNGAQRHRLSGEQQPHDTDRLSRLARGAVWAASSTGREDGFDGNALWRGVVELEVEELPGLTSQAVGEALAQPYAAVIRQGGTAEAHPVR